MVKALQSAAKHAYCGHFNCLFSARKRHRFSPRLTLPRHVFRDRFAAAFTNPCKATKLDSTPIGRDGKVTFRTDFFAFSFALSPFGQGSSLGRNPVSAYTKISGAGHGDLLCPVQRNHL
jgi:hypothetical protein